MCIGLKAAALRCKLLVKYFLYLDLLVLLYKTQLFGLRLKLQVIEFFEKTLFSKEFCVGPLLYDFPFF